MSNRVVVTAARLIHDYGPNSTGSVTNDTEGSVLFHFGRQRALYADLVTHDLGKNSFYVFGWRVGAATGMATSRYAGLGEPMERVTINGWPRGQRIDLPLKRARLCDSMLWKCGSTRTDFHRPSGS